MGVKLTGVGIGVWPQNIIETQARGDRQILKYGKCLPPYDEHYRRASSTAHSLLSIGARRGRSCIVASSVRPSADDGRENTTT